MSHLAPRFNCLSRYLPHFTALIVEPFSIESHLEDLETPCKACLSNNESAVVRQTVIPARIRNGQNLCTPMLFL